MTDWDYQFQETPNGSKTHIVDMGRTDTLAEATRGASDHAALCGHIPTAWSDTEPPEAAGDICKNCADKAHRLDLHRHLPVIRPLLEQAATDRVKP